MPAAYVGGVTEVTKSGFVVAEPVPDKATVDTVGFALWAIVSEAVAAPGADGLNVSTKVQLAPLATEPGAAQVPPTTLKAASLLAIDVIESEAFPVFETVTV